MKRDIYANKRVIKSNKSKTSHNNKHITGMNVYSNRLSQSPSREADLWPFFSGKQDFS
jgi:hypothetical protein